MRNLSLELRQYENKLIDAKKASFEVAALFTRLLAYGEGKVAEILKLADFLRPLH